MTLATIRSKAIQRAPRRARARPPRPLASIRNRARTSPLARSRRQSPGAPRTISPGPVAAQRTRPRSRSVRISAIRPRCSPSAGPLGLIIEDFSERIAAPVGNHGRRSAGLPPEETVQPTQALEVRPARPSRAFPPRRKQTGDVRPPALVRWPQPERRSRRRWPDERRRRIRQSLLRRRAHRSWASPSQDQPGTGLLRSISSARPLPGRRSAKSTATNSSPSDLGRSSRPDCHRHRSSRQRHPGRSGPRGRIPWRHCCSAAGCHRGVGRATTPRSRAADCRQRSSRSRGSRHCHGCAI